MKTLFVALALAGCTVSVAAQSQERPPSSAALSGIALPAAGFTAPVAEGKIPALSESTVRVPVIRSSRDEPEASRAATSSQHPDNGQPSARTRKEAATNEFQTFIRQTTGRDLPLYGYDLFSDPPNTFTPIDNVPVTADYVVGPGDELIIKAWGSVDLDVRTTVDRRGEINIPKVGMFSVAGIRYQDLGAAINAHVGRVFRNYELSVNFGKLRAVKVLVTGHATRPGAYDVSAQSTLVSALLATGGPSVRGTMRAIELKRDNRIITHFDLYDLLLKGDKSKDVRLQHGDVIHIPPVAGFAAIGGSVQQGAIYEIKAGMNLKDLLELAGGLTTTAQTRHATIESIENRTTRKVGEFTLDDSALARPINDGDLISIHSISPRFDNAITLRGNVASAGRYAWRDGMRVRDLVPERETLIKQDYWVRRNLATFVDQAAQADVRTQVKRAIAEPNWEYAVVERLQPDLSTTLIPFHLGKAIFDNDPAHNLLLRPGDVVTVFSKDDLTIPRDYQTKFVRIEGEVAAAGVYKVEKGETLRQVLARAGGLTPAAYLFGSQFYRLSAQKLQQEKLTEYVDRLELEVQRATSRRAQSALSPEDAAHLQGQIASQQALVARFRQIKADGRIALEIPETRPGVGDIPDIELEDGDRLVIPSKPSIVSVFGAVYNQNSFIHRPSKRLHDYVDQAGGPTKNADESSIYVLRADGQVLSKSQAGWLDTFGSRTLAPGDSVIVPEDVERVSLTKELKDWSQIIYQFALGAAGLKVLRD